MTARLEAGGGRVEVSEASARVRIVDICAHVTLQQRFSNTSEGPVEVAYRLDLSASAFASTAAVVGFSATLSDGRVVQGVVRESEVAARRYDDALAEGHSPVMLSAASRAADGVFVLSIGRIDRGGDVLVEVSFVAELAKSPSDSGGTSRLLLQLPSVAGLSAAGFSAEVVSVAIASHMRCLGVAFDGIEDVPFVVQSDGSFVASVPSAAANNRLVLSCAFEGGDTPGGFFEPCKDGEGAAAVVHCEPRIAGPELNPGEIVFLLDRSGSMAGSKMTRAIDTLQLFLRSMPMGSFFNIIGFGSSIDPLHAEAVEYTDSTLQNALDKIAAFKANLGGTNLLPGLKLVFSTPRKSKALPRLVYVLTDGDISNPEELVSCVLDHSGDTRVFTVGIAGSNPPLLERISKAGRGVAELVHDANQMRSVVIAQLKRGLSPRIVSPRIEWGEDLQKLLVFSEPPAQQFVFVGERLFFYAMFGPGSEKLLQDGESSLRKARFSAANVEPQEVSLAVAPSGSTAVQVLASWRRVKEISALGGDTSKAEAVRLCTRFSFASKFASFVGVEKRADAQQEATVLVEIAAPVPVAADPEPASTTTSVFGGLRRWFGRPMQAPKPQETPARLRRMVDRLEAREEMLEKRAQASTQRARTMMVHQQNKEGALAELKRKKLFEQQAMAIEAQRCKLEQQILAMESASSSMETFAAMRCAHGMTVEAVDSTMDMIQESMDVASEIGSSLSTPLGAQAAADEDDLLAELEAIASETCLESACVPPPPAATAKAPRRDQQGEEDEMLARLERLMSDSAEPSKQQQPQQPRPQPPEPKPQPKPQPQPKQIQPPQQQPQPVEPAKKNPAAAAAGGTISQVIALQRVDGHWDWSDQLASALPDGAESLKRLVSALEAEGGFKNERLLATALATAFVQHAASADPSLELVHKKALSALAAEIQRTAGASALSAERLVQLAMVALQLL